jgi:hypothetical protein
MCLARITKLYKAEKGRCSRRKIVCVKEVRYINKGEILAYYEAIPLKIGKWMTDESQYLLKCQEWWKDKIYKTGFHAYTNIMHFDLASSENRLVILTDITAIGEQWWQQVAVGRKMFIVPRRQEKAVLAKWRKQHPDGNIGVSFI